VDLNHEVDGDLQVFIGPQIKLHRSWETCSCAKYASIHLCTVFILWELSFLFQILNSSGHMIEVNCSICSPVMSLFIHFYFLFFYFFFCIFFVTMHVVFIKPQSYYHLNFEANLMEDIYLYWRRGQMFESLFKSVTYTVRSFLSVENI
jgi:hypothetical protein